MLKPDLTRAQRMLMTRRKPIAALIEAQQARLDKIETRLQELMTKRADEEEVLAELYAFQNRGGM